MVLKSCAALAALLVCASAFAADSAFDKGLKNESSVGIVLSGGNAKSQSFNATQFLSYGWDNDIISFWGRFLKTTSRGVESARTWGLGVKYERVLSPRFSVFAAQGLESDIFTGYIQRYNTDVGLKYKIIKAEGFAWDAEAGYRYSFENRLAPPNVHYQMLRVYTELVRDWSKEVSSKLWGEFLPNMTDAEAFQLNAGVSTSAILNSVFSLKVSYLMKYLNSPPPTAEYKTDSIFTTELVAKYHD